ncbi:hypothetical protein PtA15_13A31 [Puccinia triticina]|uniref:Ribosome assembly protein 3 n=1 Tax=Puccinia triticina TaxID=208348 RepID=A0ABY7D0F3_9BASI|nr:uncharacterized protein PtA15_13A31 [Puccinia triticina]WAQ90633.1 hypothetical protein PtA15_13A31 [Puccinia triticina]WAR60787.1 hypothetical protein PtB15_13B31 [Puccinia triticina]
MGKSNTVRASKNSNKANSKRAEDENVLNTLVPGPNTGDNGNNEITSQPLPVESPHSEEELLFESEVDPVPGNSVEKPNDIGTVIEPKTVTLAEKRAQILSQALSAQDAGFQLAANILFKALSETGTAALSETGPLLNRLTEIVSSDVTSVTPIDNIESTDRDGERASSNPPPSNSGSAPGASGSGAKK